MFTNLQNILSNIPRHAEQTDARKDIRRQNPDDPSRQNNEQDSEPDNLLVQDDHAVVSLLALKVFLENFLQSQTAAQANEKQNISTTKKSSSTPSTNPQKKTNPNEATARAARAYQNTAKTSPEIQSNEQSKQNSEALLGGEDIRIIHQLLSDIQILQKKNVEFLKIEKAETFLKSLIAAVESANS